ncbi:MAG: SDR family oxidoreductase [Candidatus Thioglobus sp.]|jgi:NAD(P)-dependent dehydrogenase (short-subunit alcohol dehydrogenase family)|nr:SDR family oxidoreductase [Candidatus Thioglobus sp.]|tara:strand:+ start:329 stop:1090 length:762 start_codon:yes stop_codon:yes gene_type:complete
MNLSDFSLNTKVALVTGGSSGIGKMMALSLARAGAYVWIASSRDNADETIKELKAEGSEGAFLQVDVTSTDALEKMLSHIYSVSGKIDILVNGAGINLRTSADELTLEQWQKTIDINLTAPYQLSQLAVKKMKESGWGRIINIASLQSLRAFDNSIPYGASKGGVMQLTRALAQAYSKDGVLVNAIAPGFFRTNLTESLYQDSKKIKDLAGKTMMNRNGEEKDIFGISVFLCSDANSYITGQTIFLDGGFSAG